MHGTTSAPALLRIPLLALLLALLLPTAASAALLTFDLEWENFSGAPGATAAGSLVLDETLLLNPGGNSTATNDPFVSFDLAISGPSAFDGASFEKDDLAGIFLQLGSGMTGPVDLTQDLVGQRAFLVLDGGAPGLPGELTGPGSFFRIFSAQNNDGSLVDEEVYRLTSFAPRPASDPIPEPNALGLSLLGAAIVAPRLRRRACRTPRHP